MVSKCIPDRDTMILVEGTLRVGDRDLPFQGAFHSIGSVNHFVNREAKLGAVLKIVDENYIQPKLKELKPKKTRVKK